MMLKFVGKDLIELIPKLNHKFTIQNIFINISSSGGGGSGGTL